MVESYSGPRNRAKKMKSALIKEYRRYLRNTWLEKNAHLPTGAKVAPMFDNEADSDEDEDEVS